MTSKEERKYTIYAIRCKTTQRIYIGCSYNVEQRVKQHYTELRNGEKTLILDY
jgi:predicted GIY-YIG superfamily endonuclease